MPIKFSTSFEPTSSALTLKYLQNNTLLLLRISTITQTSLNQAQQNLLLDFNIRQSAEQNKQWSGLQYNLKQLYSSVVVGKNIPGGIVKIWVWILMADEEIQAAIYNAVYIGFVKLGLPMQYCIYAITDKPSSSSPTNPSNTTSSTPTITPQQKPTTIILNIACQQNIKYKPIYGKYRYDLFHNKQQDIQKQIAQYRDVLCLVLNQEINQ